MRRDPRVIVHACRQGRRRGLLPKERGMKEGGREEGRETSPFNCLTRQGRRSVTIPGES